ncbi:hypothetical protein [Bacillus mycoides]|uniref:hypothetical protein n=1 Tax=Bacillus mycoides TaxID=1405 RepID=UPI0021119EEB|nr:hypothetical protein [Bacillus mycoides]MCQ6530524.1 hypothetical protein [Bacillus mycoides]
MMMNQGIVLQKKKVNTVEEKLNIILEKMKNGDPRAIKAMKVIKILERINNT